MAIYDETGESFVKFNVVDDWKQVQGRPVYLTYSQVDDFNYQLPEGWEVLEADPDGHCGGDNPHRPHGDCPGTTIRDYLVDE